MKAALPEPPLLIITDRRRATLPLLDMAGAVFDAGGRWLSLREHDLHHRDRVARLHNLVELGACYGATVMVHGDVEAAVSAKAGGVHLPHDGDVERARDALDEGALIGISAHSFGDMQAAAERGADYVTLSPIYLTESKPGYGPALGLQTLRKVARAATIPVLALGGITAANAAGCRSSGAAGIAVMGEVMRAGDPGDATRGLIWGFDATR